MARVLAAPLSTVGRVLKALGLGRLKNLQPAEPVRRYQWARPGDMIHVDTKQLARFERVGHRITGDRRQGSSRGAGYEKAHVAIDDATRLAYVEVLPDEKQATTVGFLLAEWAYSMAFQASTERNRWLPRYLAIYNGRRCHMALAGRTPFQQLGLLRATE